MRERESVCVCVYLWCACVYVCMFVCVRVCFWFDVCICTSILPQIPHPPSSLISTPPLACGLWAGRWTVLWAFGYNDDLSLNNEYLSPP